MVEPTGTPSRKGWRRGLLERLGIAVAARALWTLIEQGFAHH